MTVSAEETATLNLTASSHPTEVRGIVTDALANPIPKANVILSPQAPETAGDLSGAIGVGMTDATGSFSVVGLKPGTYKAQVRADGYDPAEQADIIVPTSGTATISVTLTKKIASHGGRRDYAAGILPLPPTGYSVVKGYGPAIPLADEFVPLILRVVCPPPPPPPPPEDCSHCNDELILEVAKALAEHLILNPATTH